VRDEGEVSVTLLLNGGHSRTLYLQRKDPLLASLVSSIGEKSYGGGRPARPFNIGLDQGRRSFIFSSTDLVGLVMDPPLLDDSTTPPAMTIPCQPIGEPQPEPLAEKAPYVLLDAFLDDGLISDLLRFASTEESVGAAKSARVVREFAPFAAVFRDRIRSLVPQLATAFGIGEFAVGDIDCTLIAQNEGGAVPRAGEEAQDAGDPAISYAFYFHNEPQSFSGGAFRLYNTWLGGGERGVAAAEIEPANNSILFFPSECPYEVLPLRCRSTRLADSRFALLGAVRRARR